jgi:hypothetical protein
MGWPKQEWKFKFQMEARQANYIQTVMIMIITFF